MVDLFIPLSGHSHIQPPHAARPDMDTFLTHFFPNGYLVYDDESGVWKPWVDCYTNTKGLHHIQRLMLVETVFFEVREIFKDVTKWYDGSSPPADSAAIALLQMKGLKRLFLVHAQRWKHKQPAGQVYNPRQDPMLPGHFWYIFNLLALLSPGYSRPEIYYVPFGTTVRAEDLLGEVLEQFQLLHLTNMNY
jgi:hypothetical protein